MTTEEVITGPVPAAGERSSASWLPAAAFGLVLLVAWIATGVRLTEALLFTGYELVYVVLPGVLLHGLLGGRSQSALDRIALGWALGIALALGAFALTAALGIRGALPFYPLVVYGVWLVRAGRSPDRGSWIPRIEMSSRIAWAASVVGMLATAYLALGFYTLNPLARDVESVVYAPDLVFNMSLAAEAKHHWPVSDPSVLGEPMRYHLFSNFDLAGVSQVTGIPLDVLLFRLWPAAVLLLIGLLVASVTRAIGGSARTALVAVALTFLVGELDVDTKIVQPFAGGSLLSVLASPTFLLGAVFFLAALRVLLERVELPAAATVPWRWVVLLAAILAAGSGAKATVIPVLIGGLALFLAGDWLRRRAIRRAVVVAGGLVLAMFVLSYIALYRGSGDTGLKIGPFQFADIIVNSGWHGPAGEALTDAIGLAAIPVMLLPLLGIAGLLVVRGLRWSARETLLLCVLASALAAYLALSHPGHSQIYFLLNGYLAGICLSAQGLVLLWDRAVESRAWQRSAWVRPVAVMLGAAVVAAVILRHVHHPVVGAVIPAYGLIALAGLLAYWVTRSVHGRLRLDLWIAAGLALLLILGALDFPVDTGGQLLPAWAHGRHAWKSSDPAVERGISRDLRSGLLWVKDNTPTSSLIAVNNFIHLPHASPYYRSRYYYYSAYAERPVLFQSWGYTSAVLPLLHEGGTLPKSFIDKRTASFDAAQNDPAAIQRLKGYGVDYLVVDKVNARYSPALDRRIRPSFENDAVAVYRL
jgi:hypothetical protein